MKKYLVTLGCALLTMPALAQSNISGVVLDDTGEPVIGASVTVKGTKISAVTDIDGKFTINATPKQTLVINYIGFSPCEAKAANNLKVTIHEDRKSIDDVVIVGFATQKKINATGAVKTIGDDVLTDRPLTNAVQGLQGAVGGLNITNDGGGELGKEMSINIRGVGSIGEGSSSSPLVLIDGMEGDLSTINPNDIENISVLKDGASASIYGSRAPFGVILVTTKGGHKGLQINYRANVNFKNPVSVPNSVDSYTFAQMVNDAYLNTGGNAPFGTKQLQRIRDFMDGKLKYGTMAYDNSNEWMKNQNSFGNTNWYDFYLKDVTTSQEHNFSLTGGDKGFTYYLSGNYMGQTGLFKYAKEKYDRYTINAKLGYKFNKYVTANWSTRYININNDKPSALNDLFYHNLGRRAPTSVVTLPNGDYSDESMLPAILYGGRVNQKTRQLYNQANIIVEPIKDWKLHFELNSRTESNPYSRDFLPISYHLPDGTLEYMKVLEGVNAKHVINSNGTFNVQPAAGETYHENATTRINYFSTNIYTDYNLKLKGGHNFTFLLGEQSEYYHRKINRFATTDVDLGEGAGNTTFQSFKNGEWSSLGFFGRVNYNFNNRYMLEFNMRADGASRFPTDQRWGYFPSVSAGWNIAEESFWKPLAKAGFEYLKFRGSYATLGNQNTTSFYPYYQEMNTYPGSVVLGGKQGMTLPMYSPFSASLTWERIENIGFGIDWGFFHNRLTGSFDWYQRTTKDMVGPANALSALYGASAPKTNNAEMRTRGWEIEVSWRDRIGKDFNYSISATLSDYNTLITKYDSPDNKISGWYKNKKYGDIWGYEVVGIAKSDAEMNAYLAKHSQSAIGDKWGGGDLMYRDLDNNGRVDMGSQTLDDHGDLKVIGNTTPRYSYSFTLSAQYKFIDIRAFFQGVGKRDFFFTNSATFFGFAGEWQRSLYTDHLDYFRYAGSELGANLDSYYGRLRTDKNNIQVCDRFLQDASYLRLKNLQIGFNLPANTKLAKWVKKARLYMSGENLITWTNLRIFDPEAIGNADNWGPGKTYPQYRTYSVGLEVTF